MPASKSRRSQNRVSRGEKLRACTETERRLLSLIRAVGPVSRAELARKTGLAPLSVTRLIADLLDRDLVTEGARVVAGRGQPSLPLSLARDAAFSYGVSITEDALSIALIDLSGVVRDAWREPFETFDKSAALTRLEKIFDLLATRAAIDRSRLLGVGVAASGFFTGLRRQLNTPLSMEQWALSDLDAEFSARLGLPIWIDNDGNAAAAGEALYGVGKTLSSFAYLYVGRGLGGGVVLDHSLWRGRNGNAGEFTGLLSPDRRADRPTLGLLREMFAADGKAFASIDQMLAELDPASPVIEAWAKRTAPELNAILSAIAATLDPEAIVIGGRATPALVDALIGQASYYSVPIRDRDRTFPILLRSQVVRDVTALGAASMPFSGHFF